MSNVTCDAKALAARIVEAADSARDLDVPVVVTRLPWRSDLHTYASHYRQDGDASRVICTVAPSGAVDFGPAPDTSDLDRLSLASHVWAMRSVDFERDRGAYDGMLSALLAEHPSDATLDKGISDAEGFERGLDAVGHSMADCFADIARDLKSRKAVTA